MLDLMVSPECAGGLELMIPGRYYKEMKDAQ